MLVARFSENIEADIKRGWSTWMTPGLGGSYEDCEQDIEDGFANGEIREFPEHHGCFGIVHHEGLSCYCLEADNINDAIEEIKASPNMYGAGYGYATIGDVKLLMTVSAKEIGSQRDLHILEVEDCEKEKML